MEKRSHTPLKVIIERLENALQIKDQLISTREDLIKIQREVLEIKDEQIAKLERKNKELFFFGNINFN
jgi:uncharacterized protein (DUF3084 family)